MTITRRGFVQAGGVALFSVGLDPLFLDRAAYADLPLTANRLSTSRPVLVCLFQRGAVDGLNMVVPHGDRIYYEERPRIGVPATDVVDLDGYFGLHPSLAALKPWWINRSLAAIPPSARPIPRVPTSTPRITWSRGRRA